MDAAPKTDRTKPKGELLYSMVLNCDPHTTIERIAEARNDFEAVHGKISVRSYRRTVSADGVSISVTVAIFRKKA